MSRGAQAHRLEQLLRVGAVTQSAGRHAEALEAYAAALDLQPQLAPARHRQGFSLQALGRFSEAITAYREALRLKPEMAAWHNDLGAALQACADFSAAADAFTQAVDLDPGYYFAHNNLGLALRMMERNDQACEAYLRCLQLAPDFAPAHANLGNALRALGQHREAVAALRTALRLDPGYAEAHCFLGGAMLELGRPGQAHAELQACLRSMPGHRAALAYLGVALAELGRHEERRMLLDHENLVREIRPVEARRYASIGALNADLAEHIRAHPSLAYQRAGNATRHGSHSGDLLIPPKGRPIGAFEKLVENAVADYCCALSMRPTSLGAPPGAWKLAMWAVVMDRHGHQIPHIHPAAWISGVYYVQIPARVREDNGPAGWIEFGRPPANLACTREPSVVRYRPREGRMLLFPSYFYHSTVPFESDEERICIAFDVVPAANANATSDTDATPGPTGPQTAEFRHE